MAPLAITCPACSRRFKGKDELRGKRIKCPLCSTPFSVPVTDPPETAIKAAPEAPKEKKAKKNLWDDEDDGPDNYGVTTPDLAPRCPHCAKELESAEAVICLHCGYNTQMRTIGKTTKVIAATGKEKFRWLMPGLICATIIVVQTIFVIWFCLVAPEVSAGKFWDFTDHESIRLWVVITALLDIWPLGIYAFNRLVLHPLPPEKVKD